MIGHSAGGGRRRLHNVEPVQGGFSGWVSLRLYLRRQYNGSAILFRIAGRLQRASGNRACLIALLPVFFGLRRMRDVRHHTAAVGVLTSVAKIAGAAGKEIGIE